MESINDNHNIKESNERKLTLNLKKRNNLKTKHKIKCSDMPESKKTRNENAIACLNPRKSDKKKMQHTGRHLNP